MLQNVINSAPYLRTTREFPFDDVRQLAFEVNKAYVDTASAVNNRIIGIFPSNFPAITGETWFFDRNLKQQSFRQIFTFTATAAITHNIPLRNITYFTKCYGDFTDGTNWYGLFFASSTAIAGQITFYLTPTQIVFVPGADPPTLTKGIIVLEWLSQA